MFKKLLEYNLKLFRQSLSGPKIFILLLYGIILGLIFSQVISTVFAVVMLQNIELGNIFDWYTPQRGEFIILAFSNFLWLTQFFFTNIRLLKLEENRKLLTMGFPLHKLARYLTLLSFAHPLNLLFNISWFILLMLQFDSYSFIPLAISITLFNFTLIFSLKFRFLTILKNYQKWILMLFISALLVIGSSVDTYFSQSFFSGLEHYLPTINKWLGVFPGGFLAELPNLFLSPVVQLTILTFCLIAGYHLHRDHIKNTAKGLQAHPGRTEQATKRGKLIIWLCQQFGTHAGKYLYYVLTHPYNKIQALIFIAFPILYVPFLVGRMNELGNLQFIILFFFMYAPMGFQLIFLGNMFGYEHRELLKEAQFPVSFKKQLKERFRGALIIPLTLLVIISGAEFIILMENENLLSILLGNMLLFEIFLGIFLWSTFFRFKKVKWVSFSFSQPVISQSVQFITGFAMFALSAVLYTPYGSYEIYKQAIMLMLILLSGFWISRFINTIHLRFSNNIMPHLWNEL